MRNVSLSLVLAVLLGLSLNTVPAHAQLSRTYVSAAIGNDANNCERPTPCRTFQVAHNKTNSDGEITVLDPGGYGAVAITKSISIVNDGVGEAGVLVSGGAYGITVNAGAAGYVNLRGLTVQGIGFGGGQGILLNNAFALTITNCVIRNLTGSGIILQPAGRVQVAVSNTLIADNGGIGIWAIPSTVAMRLDLDRIEVRNNSDSGVVLVGVSGGLHTSVSDSVISGNRAGIAVVGSEGISTAVVTRSVISNNWGGAGLSASSAGRSLIAIGGSMISGNALTWTGSVVFSFGDNHVLGNFDNDPAMQVISRK